MSAQTKSPRSANGAAPASPISDATLLQLYAAMLRCRMLRERVSQLGGRARARAFAPASEAVAAAVLAGLAPQDAVFCPGPNLLAALLRGVPIANILHPLLSSAEANRRGSAAKAHLARGTLAVPLNGAKGGNLAAALAAGASIAGKAGNHGNIALAFCHDGEGTDFPGEIFNFALEHGLPVIFVRQAARPLQSSRRAGRAKSAGLSPHKPPGVLPIIPVDCNDAVAVYRVAHEAIAHARRGSGPTLMDCVPLRVAGEREQDADCIARIECCLAAKGLRPERIKATVAKKFTRALDAAVAAGRRGAAAGGQSRRPTAAGKPSFRLLFRAEATRANDKVRL